MVRVAVGHHQGVRLLGLMAQGLEIIEQREGRVGGVHENPDSLAVLGQGYPEGQAVGRYQGFGEAPRRHPLDDARFGGLKDIKKVVHQDFHGDGT